MQTRKGWEVFCEYTMVKMNEGLCHPIKVKELGNINQDFYQLFFFFLLFLKLGF